MDPIELYADFYSPRWGHTDRYTFVLSMDRMDVSHMARKCAVIWHENSDPTWQGEPLMGTFANDSIYPPAIMLNLLVRLWTEWRDGRFTAEEAQSELDELTEYVNASTAAKPKSDFWRGTF
ncbi:hypothetical protein ACTTAI_04605 [Rhodobacter capsulatus]|uniref:hypothetical protein n=1 Tax=Rhodobacter capsulatus TaxID=1061 RepID=UPI0040277577